MSSDDTATESVISDEAGELVNAAINSALSVVADGEVLIPFALSLQDGDISDHTLVSETASEAIEVGRDLVRRLPPTVTAYALTYLGEVELEEGRADVVIVEIGERASSTAFLIAQPYAPAASEQEDLELIGEAFVLADVENLFVKN